MRPIITSGQSNLTTGRIAAAHGSLVFVRWHQCAPHLNTFPNWAHRVQIPKGISITSAGFAELTAKSRYTLQRAASCPLKIAPFHVDVDFHLMHDPFGSSVPITETLSRLAQFKLQSVLILYNGPPLPQNCSSHGESGSLSNAWSLRPP